MFDGGSFLDRFENDMEYFRGYWSSKIKPHEKIPNISSFDFQPDKEPYTDIVVLERQDSGPITYRFAGRNTAERYGHDPVGKPLSDYLSTDLYDIFLQHFDAVYRLPCGAEALGETKSIVHGTDWIYNIFLPIDGPDSNEIFLVYSSPVLDVSSEISNSNTEVGINAGFQLLDLGYGLPDIPRK